MASLKEVANLASVSLMTVSRAINNPDQLLAQRPDGIIFTSMGLRQVTIPERLRDKNIVLANCVNENHSIPSYIPDDFDGQYQAMEVLLRRGYQRPLCIYLPECTLAGKARRAGAEKRGKNPPCR
ncbi:bacterial regulatory s, lacI family protein [Yersinia enterocolitica]|nr:bacterial regulatory s, lacI family protein [Yersinia enterocolitica]